MATSFSLIKITKPSLYKSKNPGRKQVAQVGRGCPFDVDCP